MLSLHPRRQEPRHQQLGAPSSIAEKLQSSEGPALDLLGGPDDYVDPKTDFSLHSLLLQIPHTTWEFRTHPPKRLSKDIGRQALSFLQARNSGSPQP